MSLNWKEIDAVLAEWHLEGSRLKRVRQPDYSRIILEFSAPDLTEAVVLAVKPPHVRIHRLSGPLPRALPRPPRFTAVLKARLEGRRLEEVFQLGQDRIVRFVFAENGSPVYLDAKLWGNAPNIILAGKSGDKAVITDSFSRRPSRGEAPGASWPPEGIPNGRAAGSLSGKTPVHQTSKREFSLRPLPGSGSWNSRVEAYYKQLENQQTAENLRRAWTRHLERREERLEQKDKSISESIRRFRLQSNDARWGELCTANLQRISKGQTYLEAEDWNNPGRTVHIPLKAELSPLENARRYFQRQKRARRALERLQEDRQVLETERREIRSLQRQLQESGVENPPFTQPPPQETRKTQQSSAGRLPGLWISKPPYIIAAGRSAAESDTILRRWARGNDTWMHIRGRPGAHIFIRAPKGKSIPLDILLDAGNLALSYSGKNRLQEAHFHYTQVKYLRRPKDAKKGTVIPAREKNLHIRRSNERLQALKQLAGLNGS